jgi:hypothetical protein
MLALITARPDVSRSRKWTTAKAARVTVDGDALRRHFHHWAASAMRDSLTLKARLAAAELERQFGAFYNSLDARLLDEERVEGRRWDNAEGVLSLRVLTGDLSSLAHA